MISRVNGPKKTAKTEQRATFGSPCANDQSLSYLYLAQLSAIQMLSESVLFNSQTSFMWKIDHQWSMAFVSSPVVLFWTTNVNFYLNHVK